MESVKTKGINWPSYMLWAFAFMAVFAGQYLITAYNPLPVYERLDYVNHYLSELFAHGWSYWNHLIAFGVPEPIQANYIIHPTPIVSYLLFGTVDTAFLIALQTAIGVLVFYALCRELEIEIGVALVCTVSFYLSEVSARYLLAGWESVLTQTVVWTFVPVYFYPLVRFAKAETSKDQTLWISAFAVLFGLTYANGHVGEMMTLSLALAVFMLTLLIGKPQRLTYFIYAGLIILMISLWKNTFLLEQRAVYPFDVPRESEQPMTIGYYSDMFWGLFFRPLISPAVEPVLVPLLNGDLWQAAKKLVEEYYTINMNRRWLFIGGPFALVALFAVFTRRKLHWLHRSLAVSFMFSVIALCLPVEAWGKIIAVPQLWSEPVTFFGILLAGVALQGIVDRNTDRKIQKFVRSIMLWQMVIVALAMGPRWVKFFIEPPADQFAIQNYGGLERTIRERADVEGMVRYYYGPKADKLIDKSTVQYVAHNMSHVNIDVIGPTLIRFFPFLSYMHGRIDGEADVLLNQPLLDVMGIGVVAVMDGANVGPGLKDLGTYDWFQRERLRLYKNDTAWPLVSVVASDLRKLTKLPRRPGCSHEKLMCADFAGAHDARITNQDVDFAWKGDRLTMKLATSDQPRTILVTQAFWDQWKAHSGAGNPLDVFPLLEAFVGIDVPPGVDEIDLEYVDNRYRWMTSVMLAGMGIPLVVIIAIVAFRRRPVGNTASSKPENP